MRAIILAAGRGSRMGHHTEHLPKCLALLGGKSLLEWQWTALQEAGLSPLAVVTGYRCERLEEAVRGLGGEHTFHNPRWEKTNMVSSLLTAQEWLSQEPCLVSYSDIVYHPEAPRALSRCPADLAITYDRRWRELWELRFQSEALADAETFRIEDETGRVLEIGRRAQRLEDIQGQYMGLLKFTPEGWSQVVQVLPDDPARLDMTTLLGLLLGAGISLTGVPVEGRWCEVDHDQDRQRYEACLAGGAWSHDWRW